MLPQWPWVVWASTLQFPSNDAAIADGVEQMVAEAATRAMAQIRLPIIGVLLLLALKDNIEADKEDFRRIAR
jgi:hypothetical protein